MEAKSSAEIEIMRESGRINALAHAAVKEIIEPGITSRELDNAAEQVLRLYGASSSFRKLYRFPGTACISVNDEVSHGIPGDRIIQAGDVVKVDIGAEYGELHSDSAVTHCVGPVEPHTQRLIATAEAALANGIKAAAAGSRASDISHAIYSTVQAKGFQLVRHAFGHGIGKHLHEPPRLANFGPANRGPKLRSGMVLAIEPVMTGGSRLTYTKPDGWTMVTLDGSLGVHFEHTVLVTEDGPEILTTLGGSQGEGMGTQLHLQTASDSELQVLFEMAASNMNMILMEAWGRPVERSIFTEKGAVTVSIKTEAGELAGFYTYRICEQHIELITLVVDEPFQNTGIGRHVMQQLHQQAQSLGLSAIELCVQSNNQKALQFYEKLGYQFQSSPYYNTLLLRKQV